MQPTAKPIVPMRRAATVKLPGKVFEIQAVDKQAETLLELITHLNGQLDLAKSLRRKKSGLLTREEKKYADESFQGTENAMRHVATLLEPCRLAMSTSDVANLRSELMFTLRDGPGIQLTLTSLGIASQTLNTVVGVLFGKEGVSYAPLARSYSAEAGQSPPSYEESTLSNTSSANWLGRTGSIKEVEEPAEDAKPRNTYSGKDELFFGASAGRISSNNHSPAVFAPHRPGYIHPSLKPGQEAQNSNPRVAASGFEETKRRMSDMPSKTTSYMASAASGSAEGILRATDGSTSTNAFQLATGSSGPARTDLRSSARPALPTVIYPTPASDMPRNAMDSPNQPNLNPTSTTVPVPQPIAHRIEPLAMQMHNTDAAAQKKMAPPKPRKPSSAVSPQVLIQTQTHQSSQQHSLSGQDSFSADRSDSNTTKLGELPSQVREQQRRHDPAYTYTAPPGQGLGIASESNIFKRTPGVPSNLTNSDNSRQGSTVNYLSFTKPDQPPRITSIQPTTSPSNSSRLPRQHSIARKQLPNRRRTGGSIDSIPENGQAITSNAPGSSVVPNPLFHNRTSPVSRNANTAPQQPGPRPSADNAPPLDHRRRLDSTSPEVVPPSTTQHLSKTFIEFSPDAAPELHVQRSPAYAPEVVLDSAPEVAVQLGRGSMPKQAVDIDRAAPEVVVPALTQPVHHSAPEVVSWPKEPVHRSAPEFTHSPGESVYSAASPDMLPSPKESDNPKPATTEVWNASMARGRPRRTRTNNRPGESSSPQSSTASGGGSPQTIASLPAFTPRLSLDPSSIMGGADLSRPRSMSDVASIRSMTSNTTTTTTTTTTTGTGASALTGKARSQRWREAQYEKFESL